MRKYIALLFATAALAVGTVAPAASAAPVITGGLVNITITEVDVLTGDNVVTVDRVVNVALALNLAANVCDVNVGVLAQQLRTGSTACENAIDGGTATITQPS